jgi:hypothetical protein
VKGGDLNFSRWLAPLLFEQWMEIVDKAFQFNYQNNGDFVSWRWGGKKVSQQNQFTITSPVMKKGITSSTFGNLEFHTRSKFSLG